MLAIFRRRLRRDPATGHFLPADGGPVRKPTWENVWTRIGLRVTKGTLLPTWPGTRRGKWCRWRPRTRADCADVLRPCPYVGCQYHLALDVGLDGKLAFRPIRDPETGEIIGTTEEAWRMDPEWSCALDVADRGPGGDNLELLHRIGTALGMTRERVRQIVDEAGSKLRWGGTLGAFRTRNMRRVLDSETEELVSEESK